MTDTDEMPECGANWYLTKDGRQLGYFFTCRMRTGHPGKHFARGVGSSGGRERIAEMEW